MANFARIAPQLESIINTKLNATRRTQGVWEWYNALFRTMSANRFSGTPTLFGPAATPGAGTTTVVETVAVNLFGVLVDSAHATENIVVGLGNAVSTPGTTQSFGMYWGPAALITTYLMAEPIVFGSRLEVYAMLGTNAGYEAGTDATTQPNVVLIYTK